MKKILAVLLMVALFASASVALMAATATEASAAAEAQRTVLYAQNFDGLTDSAAALQTLSQNWILEDGTAAAWPDYFNLVAEGSGKALSMTWVGARKMLYTGFVPSAYEVTFRLGSTYKSPSGGFFFLHTIADMPYITEMWDAASQSVQSTVAGIPNYEDDGHRDPLIAFGVGYAGIYLKPEETSLEIGVKTSESVDAVHTYGIGNVRYFAPLPEGKSFASELLRVRVLESDRKLSVYVEGALLATVEFSEMCGSYFTKATVRDAAGSVVGETDSARICVMNTMGFVTRAAALTVDDFELSAPLASAPTWTTAPALYDTTKDKTGLLPIIGDAEAAVRIDVAPDTAIQSFQYVEMATYAARNTEAVFCVYRWETDYATTVQGKPIYRNVIFDHQNNMPCTLYFDEPLTEGRYLFVLGEGKEGVDASGAPAGMPVIWTHVANPDSGAVFYVNGAESSDAFYVKYTLLSGIPAPVDPPVTGGDEPVKPPVTGPAGVGIAGAAVLLAACAGMLRIVLPRRRRSVTE